METTPTKFSILRFLCDAGLTISFSEAKRLIKLGAVSVNDKKIDNWNDPLEVKIGDTIKVGRKELFIGDTGLRRTV